jgi:hypothetical protein
MMIVVFIPQIADKINNDLLGVGYHDKIHYHDDNIMCGTSEIIVLMSIFRYRYTLYFTNFVRNVFLN